MATNKEFRSGLAKAMTFPKDERPLLLLLKIDNIDGFGLSGLAVELKR
jgi:hypothetical protein